MNGPPPLAVRVAAAGLAAFSVAYPLRSALLAPSVSWWVRLAALAILLHSALRPAWRVPILVVAVSLAPIVPFFHSGVPRGIVHLLVISTALPWLVELVRGHDVWPARDPVARVWAAWVAVGVWSVGLALLAGYRPVFEDDGEFLRELHRLSSHYVFVGPGNGLANWLRVLTAMIDGLCAYLLVRVAARREPALHACLAAVVGVAAFGLVQAWSGIALLKAWSTYDGVIRIHSTFADPNALGAWLAMCLPAVLVLAFTSTDRWRLFWRAGAVLVPLALVFTGSRSGWGAALAGVTWLGWQASRGQGGLSPHVARLVGWTVRAGVVAAVVVLAALVALGTWRDVRQFDQQSYVGTLLYTFNLRQPPDEILKGRLLLWRTAVRMVASEPLFGIGLGRSERAFFSFSQYLDPRPPPGVTAHNTFLTVASETGLLGVGTLLLLLGTIVLAGSCAPEGVTGAPALLRVALLAGVIAFVITMLTGDRLLLREDLVMFGVVVGLAMSYASSARDRTSRLASGLAAAVVVCLVVTTPMRARAEAREVQLHRVWHGVSGWLSERDGTRFRWTSARATFFVPGSADALVVPMRRGASGPQQVVIRVNDRDADRFVLDDGEWHEMRYALPGALSSRQYHRVEIAVAPLVEVRGQHEPVGVKLGAPRY